VLHWTALMNDAVQ